MRFRWKLLILLIVIAIVPIVAMRTFGARSARSLATQLMAQSKKEVISNTKSRLTLFIDSYSQLLWQKRLQLEMALTFQAEEISRAMASAAPQRSRPLFHDDFLAANRERLDLIRSLDHAVIGALNPATDALVSYSHQVFFYNPKAGQTMNAEQAGRLSAVTPFLARISDELNGMALWHCTALKNGVVAVFPGHAGIERYDPMQQPWYRQALESGYHWSEQFRDPLSGQNVLALSMPVRGPEGSVAGVTALMIPISRLLEGKEILKHLTAATQSFLVARVPNPDKQTAGVRILARQAHGGAADTTWSSPVEPDWLIADDPEQHAAVLDDFKQGRSNVRRMRYNGCDCLWVYGPVHQDAFLLLTTPYQQILQPIDQAERFIQTQIDELIGVTRYGIIAILALVVALAFAFARTVSKPMQILAEGAGRLASGHFDTRVDIRSNDEFGEMGRVFNAVGPQLEAHLHLQQTLELAREVQQNFLPQHPPRVPGLDIAGKSTYCDEIGGDYFDFLDLGPDSPKIGVVIGDVSGHGIPSALLMTTARALLRQRASLAGSIAQIIADVNVRLCMDIEESGQFMTLFYAELRPDEGELRWIRAGHDPAFIYHPDTDKFETLMGEGTTLGVSCDVRFVEYRQVFLPGQILLLTTDGIRETRNPDDEMFGNAALRQIVRENAAQSAESILTAILAELESFRGPETKSEDDATLVVVKML